MTLRLVSDNPDPTGPDYSDIPAMLRQYAAEIETGQYGELISVVLLLERDKDLLTIGCGEDRSPYELMGLFEAAKLRVFADDLVEE
jgi:hypothetical protein